MEPQWTKSKWTYEQLERKTVQFRIPANRCEVHGIGEFRVRQNPKGLLAVEISVDLLSTMFSRTDHLFSIPQAGVDAIELHADQAVAQFRLFCTPSQNV